MSNRITVIGTIATAPHFIGADPARRLCTFRLASNERRYHRERAEWIDGPTNWFTVNVFRSLGEHAKESFDIGDRVLVTGRLRVRQWENDGKNGTSVEIDAEALGHDVRWGVSRFERRNTAAAPEEQSARGDTDALASAPSPSPDGASAGGSGGSAVTTGATGFEQPDAGSGGFANVETGEGASGVERAAA